MRQYRFKALIVLDPIAREDAAQCDAGGTRACCVIECSYCVYFPAVILLEHAESPQAKAPALVTVALHESEAGAFFAPGQRFTIWADAVVGHSVRPAGLAGSGVVSHSVPSPAPRAFRGNTARRAASLARAQLPGSYSLADRA